MSQIRKALEQYETAKKKQNKNEFDYMMDILDEVLGELEKNKSKLNTVDTTVISSIEILGSVILELSEQDKTINNKRLKKLINRITKLQNKRSEEELNKERFNCVTNLINQFKEGNKC